MAEGAGLSQAALAGRYTLLSPLGQGGMGTVWRALDEVLGREVAVKEVRIKAGLSDRDQEILYERTKREAKATARLNHPGIITVHDVVEEDGRPWIVMELVPARSLQQVIDAEGPLPYGEVAEIGRQMISALRTAHAAGILHRDVKPANVLLLRDTEESPGFRAILTDFGLAQMTGDVTLTQTGLVMGSPAYIAPERARGERAAEAADLWALGATLYAATEGAAPHERREVMAALAAVLTEDPRPPKNAGPLTPVIMGLLARDPAERLTSEAAADLLGRLGQGPVTAETAIPTQALSVPPPQVPGKGHGKTWAVVAGATALALAGGLGGYLYFHSARTHRPNTAPHGLNPRTAQQYSLPPVPSKRPVAPGLQRMGGPGYSIDTPAGWKMDAQKLTTFWRDPGSPAYLQVDRIPWTGTPTAHWQTWQVEVLKNHRLKNFVSLGIREVAEPGFRAADDEFTWMANGIIMHAVDRGVLTPSGQHFAVLVALPEAQWNTKRGEVDNILATFHPG